MTKRGWLLAIAGVAALLVLVATAVRFDMRRVAHPSASSSPTALPSIASVTPGSPSATPAATPSPSPAADSALANCLPQPHEITPTRLVIEGRKIDTNVLSVGMEDGAAGAPPKSQRRAVAWYTGSPKPGSGEGNVILTAHTWGDGSALGDELGSPTSGFQPGEVIKLMDDAGATVCYRYTHTLKVNVADYNPDSGVFYSPTGPAQIAWMACWDYNYRTKEWDSRLIFYAEPAWAK